MCFLSIVGLLLTVFLIKRKYKVDFYLAMPFGTGMLIMLLYILAFFRALRFIDFLALAEIAVFVFLLFRKEKEERKELLKELSDYIMMPKLWCVLIICALTVFLTRGQYVTWWDDLNYWATDVKGLYYNGGFAGRYGNVAPEFGDYPPSLQLYKWWFSHFSGLYIEGLQFAGYYCMNFIFMLPVIKELKTEKFVPNLAACGLACLIPSMVDEFWAYGTCADVTMGIIYGALLVKMFTGRKKQEDSIFGSLYVAVLMSVLVLVKSVAMEWAVYAVIFGLLMGALTGYPINKKASKGGISVLAFAMPLITEVSWMIFCYVNRRVAKLTSSGVQMAKGGYYLPDDYADKLRAYGEGFWNYSLHCGTGGILNISAGVLLILVLSVIVIFGITGYIEKKETIRTFLFALLTAFSAYGIILIGHLTIFRDEGQYLQADVMTKSIERYGAPFSLGFIMLIIVMVLAGQKSDRGRIIAPIVIAAAILLTVDYSAIAAAYGGYYRAKDEAMQTRQDMIGEMEGAFIKEAEGRSDLAGKRVLFIQNTEDAQWVRNTYINYNVSPIPVVYASLYADELGKEAVDELIDSMHASYVYIQDMGSDPAVLEEYMPEGEEFEFNTIYRVDKGEEIILYR